MTFDVVPGQEYLQWVIISLGLLSALFALATVFSCRSFVTLVKTISGKSLLNAHGYRSFNRFHNQYWSILGVAVLAHAMLALAHTGLPASGDSDAYIHRIILGLGLGSSVFAMTVFSSCRIFPRLVISLKPEGLMKIKSYRSFFKYHSYFWLAFGAVAAGHIVMGVSHTGL